MLGTESTEPNIFKYRVPITNLQEPLPKSYREKMLWHFGTEIGNRLEVPESENPIYMLYQHFVCLQGK